MTLDPTPRQLALLSIAAACATLGLKFAAYWISGSVGFYSDAMESFVNLAAAIVALWALTISAWPADRNHPWGHEKAEYFSSGLEGGLILLAALLIGIEAVQRLIEPTPLTHLGPGMLLSLVATAINGGVATLMLRAARKHDSIALEADAHHLMTDVWTSVGVVAGLGLLLVLPPGWERLDPLIALAVAGNIVFTGWHLLRRSADGLMDAALPPEEIAQIESILAARIAPPLDYIDLLTRKAGNVRHIQFTLRVPGTMPVSTSHDHCDALEMAIGEVLSKARVTIHVEPLP
ncbi:cation diffusion facilitator family transporter [Chitinimonas sp. BJYL2]|uniref:cation diffusion facilitator family transporter n=1 Tax=Chitinimonas sp. BJYL2 TaxID=2976696 RepID=UPI0022B2B04A|nr:cation diffusion facilitator family transporter [Chitinimonas sp. BJYL2]